MTSPKRIVDNFQLLIFVRCDAPSSQRVALFTMNMPYLRDYITTMALPRVLLELDFIRELDDRVNKCDPRV